MRTILRYCYTCGRRTPHVTTSPAHALHLLLTIVTGGLWIFVWILACARPRLATCAHH